MRNHVKIRKDYTLLVRAGKHDEAQKILVNIWDRKASDSPVAELPVKPVVKKDISKEKAKSADAGYNSLDDLSKIKGIGKKTVCDIKVMFDNISKLKEALLINRVALRDDIVEKLKEELI